MNAPMPGQLQPQPQPTPTGMPPGGAYPSGADVMSAQEGADGQIENPVIAGFRAIMAFVGELQNRGDPRAQPAAQALGALLQTIQGAPQESPLPESQPGAAPPGGEPMPGGPGPGAPMPSGGPPPGGPGPSPTQPTVPPQGSATPPGPGPQGMAFNPFTPPPGQGTGPKPVPMQRQPAPQGKRPVVLT